MQMVDASLTRERLLRGARQKLAFGNIGAVYVWAIIIAIFWIWLPATFPQMATVRAVLNDNAVTGLVALSLVVPLCARVFDLSVTSNLGLCNMFLAYTVSSSSMSIGLCVALTLVLGLVIGLVNVFVVVILRIDSFIGTLATAALMDAANTLVSKDEPINSTRLAGSFQDIAGQKALGVTLPVFYMLAAAVVIWFLLEHTATGRRLYATGFNADAARLAGVKTRRLQALSLMMSAFIAALAGVVITSRVGAGSPGIGPPYLLIGFAAVFLGATQLKAGRFNAWGTVVAVLLLGTGTEGLSLAAAPIWASDVFTGVVLIASLAITGVQRKQVRRGKRGDPTADDVEPAAGDGAPPRRAAEVV
jgi:ribose transport system permease protein